MNDGRIRSCPRGCQRGGGGARGKRATRLRVGSWNIGTLTEKSVELAKILEKRKINIAYVKETRWVGDKARDVSSFKLWYSGRVGGRNEVGILVDKNLRELVVEVKRVNGRLMAIKLVVGGLNEEVKGHFWENLDEMICGIPHSEKLFIGGDFNGHIGATSGGHGDVHGGFGFGDRNGGGTSLLDFARAFDLVIANSSFPKKREHLVTFRSLVGETQIDYLLCRKFDRGLYMDYKVIPKAKVQELGVKLVTMGAWRTSGDVSVMWITTAQCIRKAAREVLGVSKGYSGSHKGDWWWNEEVQEKVKTKKAAYLKLVESVDDEEKRANREHYKLAKKEAKLVVTAAKT
uniref:Craniofacial development protein 2-like n=1 Tax=Nicotiana tabacum TaxID=4097 RepID=A0A1S4CKI2_TOBAC